MKLVKQRQLLDIVDKRVMIADLERQVADEKAQLAKLEASVIVGLETGATVERGALSAAVQERAGQRRPAWKDEFAKLAGPEAVQQVMAATVPGPASKALVIAQNGRVTKAA
jgi:hypothetical protein